MTKIIRDLFFYCGLFSSFPLSCMFLGVENRSSKDVDVSFSFYVQTNYASKEETGNLYVKAGKFLDWRKSYPSEQEKESQAFLQWVKIGEFQIGPADNPKGEAWYLDIWEEKGDRLVHLIKYPDCHVKEGRPFGMSMKQFLRTQRYQQQCENPAPLRFKPDLSRLTRILVRLPAKSSE